MDRGNARELPLQPDRTDESGAGELIVVDVIHTPPSYRPESGEGFP
jgi:hypothetical protein